MLVRTLEDEVLCLACLIEIGSTSARIMSVTVSIVASNEGLGQIEDVSEAVETRFRVAKERQPVIT